MHLLELQGVTKHFGKVEALRGIDLAIPQGKTVGLLGPNGAGKTTLIRIITRIFGPDAGQLTFDGRPMKGLDSNRIGYMPEERGLYRRMKVGEHLLYLAQLKDVPIQRARKQIDYWLNRFDIKDWHQRKIEDLSKGMQQKVQFIATVLHEPELIILDEPFSGLAPVNTSLIREEMKRLRDEGATLIFSTHRMEQVEEICQDIHLINHGQIILSGQVAEVRERFKQNLFAVEFGEEHQPSLQAPFELVQQSPGRILVHMPEHGDSNELLAHLLKQGIKVSSFQEILPTVDEIFIQLVNDDVPDTRKSLADV